jgi:hypothetical protein
MCSLWIDADIFLKELLALCQLEGDLDFGVLDGCEAEMLRRRVGASSMAGRKVLSGGGEIAALTTQPPTPAR